MMSTEPRLRIMLIDDDRIDQMMYQRIINRCGVACEIVSFTQAKEAIEYFRDRSAPPIDLIFLDIRMPIMSGFDFLEQVERYLPKEMEIPVVMMLTTSLSAQDRTRAASFDRVRSYFTKPMTDATLAEALDLIDAH